jgi:hypothetical protein
MKKYFFIFGVLMVAIIAIWNMDLNVENSSTSVSVSLLEIEALSGCEVSPNKSLNTGYCVKLMGTTTAVCVDTGSKSPRCSGNF